MPRRRVSPQWSTTTSESRRSSKESNRSERKERESVGELKTDSSQTSANRRIFTKLIYSASSNGSHSTQDMSPCTSNAPLKVKVKSSFLVDEDFSVSLCKPGLGAANEEGHLREFALHHR